jgi:aspartyl-tRNA(Asn)/glutamyl-tRNA(Gln) amidotransferase subunit B
VPTAEDVAAVDASMPPLPRARRVALAEAAGIAPVEAALAVQRNLDALALATIAMGADAGRVLTHIEHNLAVEGADALDATAFAELVQMETGGELTATQAKTVLAEMVASGREPRAIAAELGFEAMDTGALDAVLDQVLADNPQEWERFVAGDAKERGKLTGFFVGQVMKATKGQADGKAVTAALTSRAGD